MSIRGAIAKLGLRLAHWGAKDVSYNDVGYRDAIRSGWYRDISHELFEGFHISSHDTVADVGCGIGGNSHFCAKYASHVIGVDINPANVVAARERLQSLGKATFDVLTSDGNPLPIANATADKIICTEVLEHVDDPHQFLAELARIGKRGALYLLSVPDALSEQVLKKVSPEASYKKPNHIRVIEREDFERMVTDAGLSIVKHTYYGFYWTIWNAIVWQTRIDFNTGHHPVLDHWAAAWKALLELEDGEICRRALNLAMPKSQIIIAQKN